MRCSICMATRNKADSLDRTLASIRNQHVPFEYEIIVADDGSTDATREVCQKHGSRYVYLDNDRYRNPARARNEAYRLAIGEVVIAQSDDVIHHSPDSVQQLTERMEPGAILIATVLNMNEDGTACHHPFHFYSGPKQPRAFFFLGAMWHSDLCAIGGNHEGFVEPCWDDNWFQDCILQGRKLRLYYAEEVVGHHQAHQFPAHSHDKADESKRFYYNLRRIAEKTGEFVSPGAPWPAQWPEIPRRMAFVWGNQKLSWMRYLTLASFRRHHPDWDMVLYRTDAGKHSRWSSYEQEDAAAYIGPDYSDRLESLQIEIVPWKCPVPGASATHACDLCQWEILSTVGGYYSDMDVLYVKPLPEDPACMADAAFCLSCGYMTIGLMGASPGSPIFAEVLTEAMKRYDANRYQSTGADVIYRLAGLGDHWERFASPGRVAVNHFRNRYPNLRFRELPPETVYPFDYTQVADIFEETHDIPPSTVGVHWFGGNPLAQKWNNFLTKDNASQYLCTFTQAAKDIE